MVRVKQKTSPTQKALNVWAIILIIWAFYRAWFRTSLPIWFDEFIAKPIVFILPVYLYIKYAEKRNFFSAVGLKGISGKSFVYIKLTVVGSVTFLTMLRRYANLPSSLSMENFVYLFVISLATGISEQILTTGFILLRLYDDSKNPFTATFFASILFFFIHVPILLTNEKIMGFMLIKVMLTDLMLSLSIGFTYLARKNLIPPILVHTFYNLSIYILMQ